MRHHQTPSGVALHWHLAMECDKDDFAIHADLDSLSVIIRFACLASTVQLVIHFFLQRESLSPKASHEFIVAKLKLACHRIMIRFMIIEL